MMPRGILFAFIAVTASWAVLGDDCPEKMPKELQPLRKCCNVTRNPVMDHPSYGEIARPAIRFCHKPGADAPPEGYECVAECIHKKIGMMNEDMTINKEKMLIMMRNELHEDFHEAINKSMEICIGAIWVMNQLFVVFTTGKKIDTKCPSGLYGMLECAIVQITANCPVQYWADGEECIETKKFLEKCSNITDLYV